MTAKKACQILTTAYPNMKAISCHEYETFFAFNIVPTDYNGKEPLLMSGLSVDKSTGEIKIFSPIRMSVDEYRKGKKVTDYE